MIKAVNLVVFNQLHIKLIEDIPIFRVHEPVGFAEHLDESFRRIVDYVYKYICNRCIYIVNIIFNRVFTRCVFCLSYEQMLDRILQNHRFGTAFTRIPIFLVVQQK